MENKRVERTDIKVQFDKLTYFKNCCLVYFDANEEKKMACFHNGKVWDVVNITRDILPLDNPPNTFNVTIERVVRWMENEW